MVIRSKRSYAIENQSTRRGPLVKVDLGNGRYMKVRKSAKEKTEDKRRGAEGDKRRGADGNKGQGDQKQTKQGADFEIIEGVGKASARAISENGILTFGALFEAGELDFLSAKVNAALAEWRENYKDG